MPVACIPIVIRHHSDVRTAQQFAYSINNLKPFLTRITSEWDPMCCMQLSVSIDLAIQFGNSPLVSSNKVELVKGGACRALTCKLKGPGGSLLLLSCGHILAHGVKEEEQRSCSMQSHFSADEQQGQTKIVATPGKP